MELFESCEIPSAFVSEGLQGISRSFGTHFDADGTACVWFHLLCKEVKVEGNRIVHRRANEKNTGFQDEKLIAAQQQSQANFSWLKPGFVLKIRKPGMTKPLRTSSSASNNTLAAPASQSQVELFCFGAPSTLVNRFRRLTNVASSDDLIQDPYLLLDIVFEEIYKVLDRAGWAVANIFGPIETETLHMASKPGKATKDLPNDHFTGLHNLAKHTIYLRENCESAMATLEDLRYCHKMRNGEHPNSSQQLTRQSLQYRKTLFESTQFRLESLNARMANIVELSFHIVTQGDSRLMQSESQSMKTIAVMTLVFMPMGTVAGIFGTEFIRLDDDRPFHVTISADFWMLWVIVVPLTAALLIAWRISYNNAKHRLIDDVPQLPQSITRYMGWTNLTPKRRRPLPGNI